MRQKSFAKIVPYVIDMAGNCLKKLQFKYLTVECTYYTLLDMSHFKGEG